MKGNWTYRNRTNKKLTGEEAFGLLPFFILPTRLCGAKPTRRAINFAHRTHRKGSFVGEAHPTAGDMKTDQLHTANASRAQIRTRCGSKPAAHRTIPRPGVLSMEQDGRVLC